MQPLNQQQDQINKQMLARLTMHNLQGQKFLMES